jgi:signal transduction histidine kinase
MQDSAPRVVVEDFSGEVLLSVRDDGADTTLERLEQARPDGHLGVSQSIRGRIADRGSRIAVLRDGSGVRRHPREITAALPDTRARSPQRRRTPA